MPWVEQEMQHSHFNDKRLKARCVSLMNSLSTDPTESIPYNCKGWAETQAAYRFFNNENVLPSMILAGHRYASMERVRSESVVLLVQDSTDIHFESEVGKLTSSTIKRTKSDNYHLHVNVAFTPQRSNLGVIDYRFWHRTPSKSTKRKKHNQQIPTSEKESYRWFQGYKMACKMQQQCPQTTIISMADREGALHEIFVEAAELSEDRRAEFIIRAKGNRKLDTIDDDEVDLLWDAMLSTAPCGLYTTTLPATAYREAREARMQVAIREVQLGGVEGPGRVSASAPVYAVYVREISREKDIEPVNWLLFTSLPVETFEQAQTIIGWYKARWEIEMYFRTLKQGCQTQQLQLETDHRLENAIAMYLIMAWHVHALTMVARDTPETLCTIMLTEREWKTIYVLKKKASPPSEPPSIKEMIRMLAQLGGFLGRKGDGEPGLKSIWRGYKKLTTILNSMDTMFEFQRDLGPRCV